MCDAQTFDSRDTRYKQPYGAVPSGTVVQLTLRPPRSGGFSKGVLIAYFEHRQEERHEQPMTWAGLDGDRDVFQTALDTGDYVGLIWYSFRLEGLDGRQEELGPYQLTVYDGAEDVPEWFGEGVTYQIFPDRFRRTRVPDPTGMVGGRSVHTGWDEEPEYRPDQNGEVRNRDFFGGSLAGVLEKLPYLRGLGVDTLYFCPVFEAPENHRYGTGDYEKIDPMLGTEADFRALCDAAHQLGMRVMLDGVFNHQAFVSRYFNGDGSYQSVGAAQSQDSPYYPWYHFSHWPDHYDSWWGIYSLPAVDESQPTYRDFIFSGENSIIRRWLNAGADGWRLDVADELPDPFLDNLTAAAKAQRPDALVLGEVWEDASNKTAYGVRRRYLLGQQLDTVMNYPFRDAILGFLLGGDPRNFAETVESICENYPPQCLRLLMNHIGTHDTERALTILGGEPAGNRGREWQAAQHLSPEQWETGLKRLRLASLIQYLLPGVPCLYYGDEAGMEGYRDPFNRACYPWGREGQNLLTWYKGLGQLRAQEKGILGQGSYRTLFASGNLLAFERFVFTETTRESLTVVVNRSSRPQSVLKAALDMEDGQLLLGESLGAVNVLSPFGFSVTKFQKTLKKA